MEKAGFLQRYLGYCICGSTKEETLLIMLGESTRNGKSTAMDTLLALLGDYGRAAPPETVAFSRPERRPAHGECGPLGRGPARVRCGVPGQYKAERGTFEAADRQRRDNSPLYVRKCFPVQAGIQIRDPHEPRSGLQDLSLFDSGRVHLLRFDRHFSPEEQDEDLKATLRRPENLSGVLNWLLDGLSEYMRIGLSAPEAVRSATAAYKHESDSAARFVEEMLAPEKGAEERAQYIYDVYQDWAGDGGMYPLGKQNFNKALRRLGIYVERARPKSGGNMTSLIRGYRVLWAG